MTEQEYRKVDAINYSLLKDVATNPKNILDRKDISDSPSVKQGDLLDIRMQGQELFDKKYAYFDGEVPTATLLTLAEKTIEYFKPTPEDLNIDTVISICDANNLWKTFRTETVIKKFDNKVFWDYVNFYLNNQDKLMITKQIYENVEQAHDTITQHEFTTHIFDRELLYQQDIYFDFQLEKDKSEKCKILPDLITFDHENKVIYPYDFKFMNGKSVHGFESKFFNMYYYIQSSLYTYGIRKWAKENYPDYNVMIYQFIVISDTNLTYPLIFNPYHYISLGIEGFSINNRQYPGIKQLINDYNWHLENNLWEHRREIYENNGIIEIRKYE